MPSVGDQIPGLPYTYNNAIGQPAAYERIEVQQWAWDEGLYSTAGFTAPNDSKSTVEWHVANTNGRARQITLQQLPALEAKVDTALVKLVELTDILTRLEGAVAAASQKIEALSVDGVNAADIVTEYRRQIGLPTP